MTDIPLPSPGDTSWSDWGQEQEELSDLVRAGGPYLTTRDPQYGIAGDDTTDDTAALDAFLKLAVAQKKVAYLPDRYKVSGTLQCGGNTDGQVQITGRTGYSRIRSTSTTADILRIGDGTNLTGEQVNGWIQGLTIYGPHTTPPPPANGQVALLLNKMSMFQVRDVITRYTDIGIDMWNNCYGSTLWNVKSGFLNAHNVALNLPTSPDTGAGNQIFAFNCWLSGMVAAVHISGGGDGYAFYGGQMTATSDIVTRYDDRGVIIFGKDYRTGATGAVGTISLYDVDFEVVGSWFLRGFSPASFSAQGCAFLANGVQPAIGVLKHTTAVEHSQWRFESCTIAGTYSNANPMVLDGTDGSRCFMYEHGWRVTAGDPVFNGVTVTDFQGLMAKSGYSAFGLAYTRRSDVTQMILGAHRLRFSGTTLQKSVDGGVTWTTVA